MGLDDRDYVRSKVGFGVKETRFNSDTGELDIPSVSSKDGVYRKPAVEIDSRERVRRQRLDRLKVSLASRKNTVQKPFPAWASFLFVVVGLSFLVAVLDDLFR